MIFPQKAGVSFKRKMDGRAKQDWNCTQKIFFSTGHQDQSKIVPTDKKRWKHNTAKVNIKEILKKSFLCQHYVDFFLPTVGSALIKVSF